MGKQQIRFLFAILTNNRTGQRINMDCKLDDEFYMPPLLI
jgi:hypothetical protein